LGENQVQLSLAGKNAAILAADGFDEHQMTEIQRALVKAKANIKTVAPESGVVNGWQGDSWGHHFHVDAPLGETLGSDFDLLIVPGGSRAAEKLKQNPHTRRIISHFLDANKPIAAIGEGVGLLAVCSGISGRTVAAPPAAEDGLKAAGAVLSEDSQENDGNLLTAKGDDLAAWVEEAMAFFADAEPVRTAA
jgi:deglycase